MRKVGTQVSLLVLMFWGQNGLSCFVFAEVGVVGMLGVEEVGGMVGDEKKVCKGLLFLLRFVVLFSISFETIAAHFTF